MATLRRRDFVALIGGTALMPLAARAQQPMPVIGLSSTSHRRQQNYEPQARAPSARV